LCGLRGLHAWLQDLVLVLGWGLGALRASLQPCSLHNLLGAWALVPGFTTLLAWALWLEGGALGCGCLRGQALASGLLVWVLGLLAWLVAWDCLGTQVLAWVLLPWRGWDRLPLQKVMLLLQWGWRCWHRDLRWVQRGSLRRTRLPLQHLPLLLLWLLLEQLLQALSLQLW
jgi:hypothetical protein